MSCSNFILHVISSMSGWFVCCGRVLTRSHCFAHSSVVVRLKSKLGTTKTPVHSHVHSYVLRIASLLQSVQLVFFAPRLQEAPQFNTLYTHHMHSYRQVTCSSKTVHRVLPLLLATLHYVYSFVSPLKTSTLCHRCQHLPTNPMMQVVRVSNERGQAAAAG